MSSPEAVTPGGVAMRSGASGKRGAMGPPSGGGRGRGGRGGGTPGSSGSPGSPGLPAGALGSAKRRAGGRDLMSGTPLSRRIAGEGCDPSLAGNLEHERAVWDATRSVHSLPSPGSSVGSPAGGGGGGDGAEGGGGYGGDGCGDGRGDGRGDGGAAFDLSKFPSVFRTGDGARQLTELFSLFYGNEDWDGEVAGGEGRGAGGGGPTASEALSVAQLCGVLSQGFGVERVQLLLETLVSRRLLKPFVAGGVMYWRRR
jgi:hypothetical protein